MNGPRLTTSKSLRGANRTALHTLLLLASTIIVIGCGATNQNQHPEVPLFASGSVDGAVGSAAQLEAQVAGIGGGESTDRAEAGATRMTDSSASMPPTSEWQNHVERARYFPFFETEDRWRSVSVGTTSDGWLANGVPVPPSRFVSTLPRNYVNELNYGTEEMVSLILHAGERVAFGFPDSMLFIGHIARRNGGDIDYSVSHNSGRDADLAFYSTNPFGWQSRPTGYMHFNRQLRSDEHHGFYKFDVPRNAELVRALFTSNITQPQYMFTANHLRRRILRYLLEHGMSQDEVSRLRVVLREPGGGALPHDDHLHLRILCSRQDVCGGCVNTGLVRPWMKGYSSWKNACVDEFLAMTSDSPDDEQRARAIERLALMDAQEHKDLVITSLDDESPRVRAAAARTLGGFGDWRNTDALVARDQVEEEPLVRCTIAEALGEIAKKDALEHLAGMISEEVDCPSDHGSEPLALIGARAAEESESRVPVPALIERLADPRVEVRHAAASALHKLTNVRVRVAEMTVDWGREDLNESVQEQALENWRTWHDRYQRQPRDKWLIEGFEEAGFDVNTVARREIPELVKAIDGPPYVSWNARRLLARLTGIEKRTWEWEKDDATRYWRIVMRWRGSEFGL